MQFRELTERYQLQKIVKSSRFGTIFRASDGKTGGTVAIKLVMENPDGPSLSLNNPVDREIIKRKFFEKNPEMLERLRQQDKLRLDMKKKKP